MLNNINIAYDMLEFFSERGITEESTDIAADKYGELCVSDTYDEVDFVGYRVVLDDEGNIHVFMTDGSNEFDPDKEFKGIELIKHK